MWCHTDGGPSHDCWLTVVFQHRLHWCLTSDPPWVICHQLFHHWSRCRQEWLLIDCFVVGCNNEHSSSYLLPSSERWRGLCLVLKGKRPWSTSMRLCSCKSFLIQLHLQKKWGQGFLNESLQTAFPNNVLMSKFHDECAKVNSPSVSLEERGGVSRALSHLKEYDTIPLALKRAVFDRLKKNVYTTN